jgi:hypothetical protein
MGILLILLFLPCVFIWGKAVFTLAKSVWISGPIVLSGILLALFGIIWPLLMWKVLGSVYVFGPPFVYLLFCVISPYYLGEILLQEHSGRHSSFGFTIAHSLFLAVGLLFPFLCAYYFLAPDALRTCLGIMWAPPVAMTWSSSQPRARLRGWLGYVRNQ